MTLISIVIFGKVFSVKAVIQMYSPCLAFLEGLTDFHCSHSAHRRALTHRKNSHRHDDIILPKSVEWVCLLEILQEFRGFLKFYKPCIAENIFTSHSHCLPLSQFEYLILWDRVVLVGGLMAACFILTEINNSTPKNCHLTITDLSPRSSLHHR